MTGRTRGPSPKRSFLWLGGRRVLIVSAVVFVVVAGGVAFATIPDSGTGLIHGCFDKTTGALRVIDPSKGQTCSGTEGALNWNQRAINWRGLWKSTITYAVDDAVAYSGTSYLARLPSTNSPPPGSPWLLIAARGLRGPTGAPGTKGDTGSPGPAGISSGVSLSTGTSVALNQVQVLTPVMTTPPVTTGGQYYVNASIMLIVAQGDTVACIAEVNGAAIGPFTTVGPVANQTYETLPLAVSVPIPAGSSVAVDCTGYTGNASTSFYDGGITATLIDSDNAPSSSPSRPVGKLQLPPAVTGRGH